ncbi:centromere protein R isoform X2 [Rhinatrema bivittatum]|uniref:centromere protein R isoform X2 n=1 Tax=Rhinatrema bivittatum TaxID=194408 RepID=UPI001127966E|nr:centromere protein R isoform X2 [Rhinatrema bivittatum]
MPVRRSLRMGAAAKENQNITTPVKKKHERNQFSSPATGTCQNIPAPPPSENSKAVGSRKEASKDHAEAALSGRGQPPSEEDDFMALLSEVEESLGKFVKMRQNLKHLQTLEGSREPENVIDRMNNSRDLKAELQKTKVLMAELEKRKRLHRTGQRPPPACVPAVSSYDFLKSIIH